MSRVRPRRTRTNREKNTSTTTSKIVLPEELPSVEEALKDLAAAMNVLKTPGLSKRSLSNYFEGR
jgi:hypothetical protein